MDCSPPGSSVLGISQAIILERVAISFSRGSPWPRDRTQVSCIGRRILYHWATQEALCVVGTLINSEWSYFTLELKWSEKWTRVIGLEPPYSKHRSRTSNGITKELIKKCRISGCTAGLLNQNLHFNHILEWFMNTWEFEKPWYRILCQ